jgi:hypothetical protein
MSAGRSGVLLPADEALGGVGGAAGMKNDGIDATVACQIMDVISFAADIGCFTMIGTA